VSVSGISSGAFMANQLHIAHSADVMGAAMIAGGPYGCAVLRATSDGVEALASQAAGPCMSTRHFAPDRLSAGPAGRLYVDSIILNIAPAAGLRTEF
jgi:poly(3-hydroxybutyrate) depolymerase